VRVTSSPRSTSRSSRSWPATPSSPEEISATSRRREEALKNLDEAGIVYIGAEVKAGDILVGKVTPKGESPMKPEEKLLRAIFARGRRRCATPSLKVPPGVEGTVVEVRVFNRRGVDKDERAFAIERDEIERPAKDRDDGRRSWSGASTPAPGNADEPGRGRRAEGPQARHADHRQGAGAEFTPGQWRQIAVKTTRSRARSRRRTSSSTSR